jgi:hypothetical protein
VRQIQIFWLEKEMFFELFLQMQLFRPENDPLKLVNNQLPTSQEYHTRIIIIRNK